MRVNCPDTLAQLPQRFPSWGGDVELITLPGSQTWRITLLDLRIGEPLPAPKGDFPQVGFGLHAEGVWCRNGLGCLPGTLQITGVEGVDGLRPEPLCQGCHLPVAVPTQGHISLPLKAPLRGPGCGGVAH